MPISILMPALSPTMTEGTLAKWLKKAGDTVTAGDVVAEIETDKATMEVEAVDEGVLGKILVDEGAEGVAVNTPIAVILEDGEDESDLAGFDVGGAPAPAAAPAAAPAPAAAAGNGAAAPAAAPAPAPAPAVGGARIFASPLARRMAAQAGVDLAQIHGSGPHGRIVKSDVEAAQAGGVAAPAAAAAGMPAAVPLSGDAPFELEKANTMRKVIAQRLTESKQTVPHFYVTMDVELDRLLAARKELNDFGDGAFKVSVNDMVIKALALALTKVPKANAEWSGDGIKYYQRVDVSVAVAIEGGLVTPVIRGAEQKGLRAISEEMSALAAKAREGKLMPEEYQGGTTSVSNMGMFGVREFAAVINPPQGSILAVGAGEPRPVVRDGELAVATVMSCTLSVDHRVVDGALGAQLLKAFKGLIENPGAMLL